MNILNKEWKYKTTHILYIEYKFDYNLADEKYYDLISLSHGKLFKIHIEENDEMQKQSIKEIMNINSLIDSYNPLSYSYIGFKLIDRIYEELNVKDYHKMHFDIKSPDGTYGLILFKEKMIEVSYFDLKDILYDVQNNNIEEIKEMYKYQELELNKYFNNIEYEGR